VKVGEKYKQGQYVVMRKLGWGHFSTVWQVEETGTGKQFALKVCILSEM
jgi:serine/threonine-protein kinase SRPK3